MSFKTIFITASFAVLLLVNGLIINAQSASSIIKQNKIRTCLNASALNIARKINRDCRPGDKDKPEGCERWSLGAATKMRVTGTCEAPNGCEIWHQNGARPGSNIKAGMRKVFDHVRFGKINVVVSGTFQDHVGHRFFAIGEAPVVTKTVVETGKGGIEAENETQQVGQVSNFEFPQNQSESEGVKQKCTSVYWDPFGRVFDAVSLEPISGVSVSLFQSPSRELVLVPDNPTRTDKDGVYNILIDTEDDYFLTATPPQTHLFTRDAEVDPNFSKVYTNIYNPGEVFHEVELPAVLPENFDFSPYHHDIPLKPKGKPYRGAVAEVIEETLNQVDFTDFVAYSGRVTFPLAKVCLVGEVSGILTCGSADKYGVFNLFLDKSSLPQEFIQIETEKVDLTKLN